jgi:hypothetical protein
LTKQVPEVGLMHPASANQSGLGAPALDDLRVCVPLPDPVTADEVFSRLCMLAFSGAGHRERAVAERLAASDLVLLEVVTACAGRVVPLSAHWRVWVPLATAFSVGLSAERLLLARVGEQFDFEVTLPSTYWEPRVAGQPARVLGRVAGARELTTGAFDHDAFWQAAGTFPSLAAAVAAAVAAIDEERAAQAWLTALHGLYDLLLERHPVEVSNAAIDTEVLARWQRCDELALLRLHVEEQQRHDSRDAWLTSGPIRLAAARSLAISALNEAIARDHKLVLDPVAVEAIATTFGLTSRGLAKALTLNGNEVLQTFGALQVAQYLMQRAQVTTGVNAAPA